MKRIPQLAIMFIGISALVGCESMEHEIKSDQFANFTVGKTSIEEVTLSLGQPISSTTSSDGRRIINYAIMHNRLLPETIVPTVGAFAGSVEMRTRYVKFTFDKDGILENYMQSEFNSGLEKGLIDDEYRNVTLPLPQEQAK